MKSVKVITFLTLLCFFNFCESKLCFDEGITWSSDGLLSFIPQILSPEECLKLCLEEDNCNGYTWHGQYNKRLRLEQSWPGILNSNWKRIRQKCYQFFINEKFISLPAFYLLICLMKTPKNFEKSAIFEIWQLVSFWGVKIHLEEKYAWFAIEILFMEANLSLGYVMVPKK